MDYISDNPYRILGVFANDPIKVRTANIARIRAFAKVGKECRFESDYIDLLGPVKRDEDSITKAISQLSADDDAELYALFWIHRTPDVNVDAKAGIDIFRSGGDKPGLDCFVNRFVGALLMTNNLLAAEYAAKIFNSGELKYSSTILGVLQVLDGKLYKGSYELLCGWWVLFKEANSQINLQADSFKTVSHFFNNAANKAISEFDITKLPNHNTLNRVVGMHRLFERVLSVAFETSTEGGPNAESQIALSKYSERVINKVQAIYNTTRYWDAKPVEDIISFIKEILAISYSSNVKNKGLRFLEILEKDIKTHAPKELSAQSEGIRKAIENFCTKPDEISYSQALLIECAPHLAIIKSSLGAENEYYTAISTRIADNALYACEDEFNAVNKTYEKGNSLFAEDEYTSFLEAAWQLCVDIDSLDLHEDFRQKKLRPVAKKLKDAISKFPSLAGKSFKPSFTLKTEKEIFENLNDYQSLAKFISENPSSPYIAEAKKRLSAIEDKSFPQLGTSIPAYIKALFAYKEAYPNSHNENRLLNELNNFLLGRQYLGSIDEYNRMLYLWPNHPRANLIKGRIDYVTFKSCSTITEWEDYLKSFPTGLYRKEAAEAIESEWKKIQLSEFQKCKTVSDYNRFIIKYPSSSYVEKAQEIIEDNYYQAALSTCNHDSYYKRYPNGRYYNELKRIDDDKAFKSCKIKAEFINYLEKHQSGANRPAAQAAINKFNRRRNVRILCAIALCLTAVIIIVTSIKSCKKSVMPSPMDATIDNAISDDTIVSPSNSTPDDYMNDEWDGELPSDKMEREMREAAAKNRLSTGSRPYSSQLGRGVSGENYIKFKTSQGSDYIVIVKFTDGSHADHIYIRGGDTATMYLPDGEYRIYFYSGIGWNPEKHKGNLLGGFTYSESLQKDKPIDLYSQYCEYTLYPVQNGNLNLKHASESEAF